MSYLEELLPEFRKGAKIRNKGWQEDAYIEKCGQGLIYHNIQEYEVNILADGYELYKEPIDWDYIIKNKCLCWFSNGGNSANIFGYLQEHNHKLFVDIKLNQWENCRPVLRDELTFYEDRED